MKQTIALNESQLTNLIKRIVFESVNSFRDSQVETITKVQPEIDAWIEANDLPLYTKVYDGKKVYGLEIRFTSDNHSEDFAYKSYYWLFLKPYNKDYLECSGWTGDRLIKVDDIQNELYKQLEAYRQRSISM